MGGDDSQKLLPWRGMLLLSGAQLLPLQRRINTLSQRWARVPKSESFPFPAVGAAVIVPAAFPLETSWFMVAVRYWHSPAEINQSEIDAEKTGVGLAGMSTSTAGYTTRRYRGIAAWSTLVPLRW